MICMTGILKSLAVSYTGKKKLEELLEETGGILTFHVKNGSSQVLTV